MRWSTSIPHVANRRHRVICETRQGVAVSPQVTKLWPLGDAPYLIKAQGPTLHHDPPCTPHQKVLEARLRFT